MLVRKLKCYFCGSNKVNEIQSMFIYCDYCGTWMGTDMKQFMKDVRATFNTSNTGGELQQEYRQATVKMAEAGRSKDKEQYMQAMVRMKELEFDLFPHQFGPKGKQKEYKKKYLNYHRQSIAEMMEDPDYLSRMDNSEVVKLSRDLHYTFDGTKVKYVFDDQFIAFINHVEKDIRANAQRLTQYPSIELHPEGRVVMNAALSYSVAMSAMLQVYDEEIAQKIIAHFKLEHDFVEIGPVNFVNTNCCVCNAALKVPENASTVICESCGNSNNVKEKTINCLNCGNGFAVSGQKAQCPNCGSIFQSMQGLNDITGESDLSQNP